MKEEGEEEWGISQATHDFGLLPTQHPPHTPHARVPEPVAAVAPPRGARGVVVGVVLQRAVQGARERLEAMNQFGVVDETVVVLVQQPDHAARLLLAQLQPQLAQALAELVQRDHTVPVLVQCEEDLRGTRTISHPPILPLLSLLSLLSNWPAHLHEVPREPPLPHEAKRLLRGAGHRPPLGVGQATLDASFPGPQTTPALFHGARHVLSPARHADLHFAPLLPCFVALLARDEALEEAHVVDEGPRLLHREPHAAEEGVRALRVERLVREVLEAAYELRQRQEACVQRVQVAEERQHGSEGQGGDGGPKFLLHRCGSRGRTGSGRSGGLLPYGGWRRV